MVKVRLIDPTLGKHDPSKGQEHARVVPLLENYGIDPYVPSGSVIEVPDEVAGAGPSWRQPKDGDDLAFMDTRNTDGKISVHDLGHGLLAQTDVWEKVTDAPKGGDK